MGLVTHAVALMQEGFAALATTLVPATEAVRIRALAELWDEILAELARGSDAVPSALLGDGHALHTAGSGGSVLWTQELEDRDEFGT